MAPVSLEVDQQHDDRADHRADDSGGLKKPALGVFVEDQIAQEAADKRSHDPEHHSGQDGEMLSSRDDESSQRAGDESDDEQADEKSKHEVPL